LICPDMDHSYDEEPKITLFPTRLREFEEKNNLVFQHVLSAKNLRRNSDISGLNFGDQYTRRKSCTEVDVMDYDEEKFDVMSNVFRRNSIVTTDKRTGCMQVLQTKLIPLIFKRMGQDYDQKQLERYIKSNDPRGLGVVDFDGYQRIFIHFVRNPHAIEKAKAEEFRFANLINEYRNDSENSENSSSPDLSDSE